jgi:alpha-tubulin suppressor-like RCC1 family protein
MRIADWTGVRDVAVAQYAVCAVLATGELHCWGSHAYGELGIGEVQDLETWDHARSRRGARAARVTGLEVCPGGVEDCAYRPVLVARPWP